MKDFCLSPLYRSLPVPLQNSFVTLKGLAYKSLRGGRRFVFYQKQLIDNEKLSADQLAALQLSKLQILLRHANENVPFYKRQFRELGFDPRQLKSVDELKQLPILEKETIRKHLNEFVSLKENKLFLFKGSTAGSTGTPLDLYMNRELIQSEHAFMWRQFRWAGCPPTGRIASLRGDMIVPVDQKKPPYWRYDRYSKNMWLSSYHISEATAREYLDCLREYSPHLIYSYPSTIFILAQFARDLRARVLIPNLAGIVTSSETLYDYQKNLIEETFRVPVYDWYGAFERVVFIGTCEHRSYHVFSDYGITEFIPMESNNGETYCDLIGTGFINTAVPLIRYKQGDGVVLAGDRCTCGTAFPKVERILGRIDDIVVTLEGRMIGSFVDLILSGVTHISEAQIVQEKDYEITVNVVPDSQFSTTDENKILKNAMIRLGKSTRVRVSRVNNIARLPNGKYKTVICRLQRDSPQ